MITLFIDGIDGSGKTTITKLLRHELQHQANVWERWVGSIWVYDQFFNRQVSASYVQEMQGAKQLWPKLGYVLLTCRPAVAVKRDGEKAFYDLVEQQELFKAFFHDLVEPYLPMFIIDTTTTPPEKVAERIVAWARKEFSLAPEAARA